MSSRRAIRRVARIAGVGALTAGMLPGMLAHRALVRAAGDANGDAVRDAWLGAWCSATLGLFGVRVLAQGLRPGPGRAQLIVSNHRSAADILVLLRAFGGSMVSRADLAGWPVIGFAARSVGTVFVDRSDAASGATALRSMRSLLASGTSVLVFPEGTTFPDDEVRPFQPGAFLAAARAGADVVPVGLAYQTGSGAAFFGEPFTTHLARMAAAEPSRVAMCVGQVLENEGHAREANLRARAHAAVQDLVRQARLLVDAPAPATSHRAR